MLSGMLFFIVPAIALGITAAPLLADTELAYDDGSPEGGVMLAAGQIAAVRMTPAAGTWTLKTARYYLYQGEGKVRIFADAGGSPGSDLITGFNTTPSGDGWFDVDLRSYKISVTGDFYVGIEGVDAHTPCSVGHDFLAGGNGRAWNYTSGQGWTILPEYTYFIRSIVTDEIGIDEEFAPEPFARLICAPNPFSSSMKISYTLAEPTRVRVTVWDCCGRLTAILCDAEAAAGVHSVEWNGADKFGKQLPVGVYFLKIETRQATSIQKIVRIR